ncbi:MAG: hypothetical protein FJ245_00320 [Nitrospira sp.]|nr:hypothetical protein [Nitrospira sp.]
MITSVSGRCRVAIGLILLSVGQGCVSDSRPGLPPSGPFSEQPMPTEAPLPQGVAVGDVTDRSAVIWVRTDGPARVQVVWSPDRQPEILSQSAVATTVGERDFTLAVPAGGLAPTTAYRYRVLVARIDGRSFQESAREAGQGRFRTAAAPDVAEPVTFLWSGDLGGQQRCRRERFGYPIFDAMLGRNPSFFIFLGDTIYGDDRCPAPPNEPGGDFLAATLDDYRGKHRYQRGDWFLQRFLASVPVYVIWDDHEVRNNFSGPSEPLMPTGRQALLEYWPIGTPPEDPTRLYRKVRHGADLELFILDTRQYRSKNSEPDGPGKTMLGAAQREWLIKGLSESTATWKIIATSVPLSNPKGGSKQAPGNDSWARGADGTGFQTELQAIVQAILDRRVTNLVWLAGDVHFAQANVYDPNGDGKPDFHEFICGPLSAAPGKPTQPNRDLSPSTLFTEGDFQNFCHVTVNGSTLLLEVFDQTGRSHFSHRLQAVGP